MKKNLLKTTIASFVIIFILSLFLIDRTILTTDAAGLSSPMTLSISEYLSKVFGYSLVITAIIVLGVYLISFIQKKG
ncbi:hypothetical protein BA724_17310 [Domibacillus iocasae]|uniref:Uncharacterized protein n=1 Tax=Domibacillus iocasae TaxID=1714016 RepID=A0A1E7DS55_9BACI|nr:hypothetical protein BA724_17310 [Domibacillus iocasae]